MAVLACVGLAVLGHELARELDPIGGEWEPDLLSVNGKSCDPLRSRIYLRMGDGTATAASTWTCGVRYETFAEGDVLAGPDQLEIVNAAQGTKTPLQRLPGRRLRLVTSGEEGPMVVEFHRVENLQSFFDLFGWK